MGSISHILAGFSLGFKHRIELKQLLNNTSPKMNILAIDQKELRSSGISALALDFDGVLAPHGDTFPIPEATKWIRKCEAIFGCDKIFILSNKPTEERRVWFVANFPNIRFISDVRKKPYPDGLIKIGKLCNVPLPQILMVDDRLMTGCLAAVIAGARPCYIRKPYIATNQRPLAELFFWLLRSMERVLVRIFSNL